MAGDNVLFMQRRNIAGYIPNVVLEERHEDRLAVTEHPVELGAAITDHSYKYPSELTMRVMWNSGISSALSGLQNPVQQATDYGTLLSNVLRSVSDVYEALLKLQASRQVFDVVTGKRSYKNMLLERLTVTTERDTENILEVVARFKQVIIVQTQAVKLPNLSTSALPKQANFVQRAGTKTLQDVQDASGTINRIANAGVSLP